MRGCSRVGFAMSFKTARSENGKISSDFFANRVGFRFCRWFYICDTVCRNIARVSIYLYFSKWKKDKIDFLRIFLIHQFYINENMNAKKYLPLRFFK